MKRSTWKRHISVFSKYITTFISQSYSHLHPISKTIQVRRTRHTGHCGKRKDKPVCYILQWTPTHACANVDWSPRTYLHQFWADTGFSLEDLPVAMDDSDGWREKFRFQRDVVMTMMMMMMMIIKRFINLSIFIYLFIYLFYPDC